MFHSKKSEMTDSLSWHGRMSFTDCTLIVKNFIQCYQHEISFEIAEIVDCRSSWNYVHVLFRDGSLVRFPWKRNLQPEHFNWLHIPSGETLNEKVVSISTIGLPESSMFSHCGLHKLKNDSSIKHSISSSFLIGCSDNSLFFVDNSCSNSKLYCIKENTFEAQFIPLSLPTDVKIMQISCGKAHTILLISSGCVYSLGVGTKGELGHGTTDCLQEPKLVEALLGLKIKQIAAGGWHSAALTEFGDVYLWGWNANSQLGLDKSHVTVVSEPTFVQIDENTEIMIKSVSCGIKCTAILTEINEIFVCGVVQIEPNENDRDYANFTKLKIGCRPLEISMTDRSLIVVIS